ncbi:MAG: hypothetical protein GY899_19010 [Verrucomicrobiaceae bacterium]|nr:hypothetical protein [Verrucomicrobiaceae bacterium]
MIPGYLAKMLRRGSYGRGFGERLGIYSARKKKVLGSLDRPVWIHAVSVGEVNIARKLVAALRDIDSNLSIVISTTTPTGFAIAGKSDANLAIYNPVDLWPVTRRALRVINPRAMVLVEAEVWPNLVHGAIRRGVEVSLVSARLSLKSERHYRKFRLLTAPVFGMLNRVCVQEIEDVARWRGLGVDSAAIKHLGSIKFDSQGVIEPVEAGRFRELLGEHLGGELKRILLAGSTHPGEEALIGNVYGRLRERFPDLYFVVAPRHVERLEQVLADLRSVGLNPGLRSEMGSPEAGASGEYDCLVIDTTGELGAWYYVVDLVVIGKSFLAHGGQNPVEAVFADKPVFFGPHMENFTALVDIFNGHGCGMQVTDEHELENRLMVALDLAENEQTMAEQAKKAMSVHHGAAQRSAMAVLGE